MLENNLHNDILSEFLDTSHPILTMLWDDDSFDEVFSDVNPNTTALDTVLSIIHSMTGIDVSKEKLVHEATARRLFNEGTLLECLGKMLSLYDIGYHVNENGTTADIITELVQGRILIVAVDIGELLADHLIAEDREEFEDTILDDTINDEFGIRIANHAIGVTNVNLSNPDDIQITINDSDLDDGAARIYSLSDFIDVWENSGFHYIATNNPPLALDQTVSGFDTKTGTFPEVAAYFESHYKGFLDNLMIDTNEAVEPTPQPIVVSVADLSDTERDEIFTR